MELITDIIEWKTLRAKLDPALRIGFVPTMGALHKGHISLCTQSLQHNDITLVSLFLNPTQFDRPEDLQQYPQTFEADLQQLRALGVTYCLCPTAAMMYPDHYRYRLTETTFSQQLEGNARPGHFTGMLTIVLKLLLLVKPHQLYVGEKDAQQAFLIRDLIDAFFLDIRLHICPTVREPSGLAYSSRNLRLSPEEKILAETFARIFHQDKPLEDIRQALLAQAITIDYLEEHDGRRFAAVHVGPVRLIDNYRVAQESLTCAR